MNDNLFLIGYRATGKSTVGRRVADALQRQFFDADVELESAAGKTIAEIFADDGESTFRDLETQTIARLAKHQHCIIALGGGAVMRDENRQMIRTAGKTVWLVASPECIEQRVNADPLTGQRRPNLTTAGGLQEIREILAHREPVYGDCADLSLDTEKLAPSEIADKICLWVQQETE
ncbi:MAG: shikimate kinase [Pirellulaceae bacterium]